MDTIQLDINKKYTFADYLTWMDDKRRELIDGIVKMMTPSPLRIHQSISFNLSLALGNLLKKQTCKIYVAPFDVRLPQNPDQIEDDQIFTVVQPDISIICDRDKLDRKGCIGAPDMIIEIISPQNAKRDTEEKFQLYEKHGVREYWIVYPESKTVNIFLIDKKGKYQLVGMFANDSKVEVNIFKNMIIDLEEVFED